MVDLIWLIWLTMNRNFSLSFSQNSTQLKSTGSCDFVVVGVVGVVVVSRVLYFYPYPYILVYLRNLIMIN